MRGVRRACEKEILDEGHVPEHLVDRAYAEVTRIHALLGDTRAIVRAIRRDPLPVRRVLDIGCAYGGVLGDVRRALRVEVIGIDVAPPGRASCPILRADATCDPLPEADVAFCMHMGHHLAEADLIALIRNVGRSCRRFLLMDLVRHPLPLGLFRAFVAPFVSPITAADGLLSVRKAYDVAEMKALVAAALFGSGATARHSVAPLFVRQMADIRYGVTPTTPTAAAVS